ncbi:hypothetical protein [Halobaculum sp. MBLA0143]|uniref:hypothetical protein n=1 Tax=Halobaculum sp. MBLA0143 TaxID=3079933 RepID=UPI003524568C
MSNDSSSQKTRIVDQVPDPSDFGTQLLDAVRYLSYQDNTALSYPSGKNPLEQQRALLDRIDFEGDWQFELDPPWEVVLGEVDDSRDETGVQRPDFENARGYAQISGEVRVADGEFEQYSFSLCLLSQERTERRSASSTDDEACPCCWNGTDRRWRVARRLHFDIDVGKNDDEPKPMAHLQVGGETPRTSINYTEEEYHYCDSPLDKPRIPFPPTDPVILLNMLIQQYPGISSADGESWRGKVRESEKVLRKDYDKFVGGVYSRESRDTLLSYLSNGEKSV